MIQKKLKQLIDKYCMGVVPTDAQQDEISDMVAELGADRQEVADYMKKMQNGPTREEVEAKRKAEREAKKKAELEAKKKAEQQARRKAQQEAERKAERKAREEAEREAFHINKKDDKKQDYFENFWISIDEYLSLHGLSDSEDDPKFMKIWLCIIAILFDIGAFVGVLVLIGYLIIFVRDII